MTSASPRDIVAAVVRQAGGPFLLEPALLRGPKPDEVVVQLVATGLCHADILARDQHYPAPSVPLVLGHEGAGIVVEKGSAVDHLQVGDHVVLSFAYCGACGACESGGRGYCDHFTELNFGGSDEHGHTAITDPAGNPLHDHFFGQSSFATYAVVNQRYAVSVSKSVPLNILGPLGCGVQTGAGSVLRSLDMAPGSSFAVFGAGAVGLSALLASQLRDPRATIVVDIVPERLELARELGATHVIDGRSANLLEALRDLSGGGVDVALDTTGNSQVIEQGMQALGKRGSIGLVAGVPGGRASFEILPFFLRGCTIRGIIEGDSIAESFIPELLEHYEAGRFPFDKLLSFYPFEGINQAVEDALSGKAIKPVLTIG
ncbi:NAD(P)-dependent alcohol dehydrogenase [Novosphingobium terrae]|uniref:NAD(P)-dependent alcohol dehydrogenase n=1 Tax=Novosphingobium terrae TaxID=2726189 RepID=UPI00197CC0A8|nr:NAD(P)-dependent alcohol dehydrogenase [Novosphingobium terrae]